MPLAIRLWRCRLSRWSRSYGSWLWVHLLKQITPARVVLVLFVLPFAWYTYREAVRDVIVIDSINVPKRYEELGFTSSVMGTQVAERLQQIEQEIETTSAKDRLQQSGEPNTLEIEVPATKMSLKTGVQLVQQVLHSEPKHVRGEITFPWSGKAVTTASGDQSVIVWYHIYTGSELRLVEKEELRATDPDMVVQQYAEGLLKRLNPYLWAIYLGSAKHDIPAKIKVAEGLANSTDHQVSARGYILLGDTLIQQNRPEEAIEKYRKAIELNPKFADVYTAWGAVLKKQGKPEEASEKFRKAAELDPVRFPLPH